MFFISKIWFKKHNIFILSLIILLCLSTISELLSKESSDDYLTINYGSEYVFNSGTTLYIPIAKLDSTHAIIAYKDASNLNYGTAIIATISGTTITYGSEYVFNSGAVDTMSVASLDSTHAIIIYRDMDNFNYGTAIIATISGDTITYGSEYIFNSGNTTNVMSVASLDSTHAIIGYRDASNSNYGTAIIATISGTTITYGSEYVFNSGDTNYISISSLDSTHAIIGYRDITNSYYGTAIIATISGDTITYGSEYVFNPSNTDQISVTKLDSTHAIIGYRDISNSNYGTAIIATISGDTISYGSEYVFNSGNTMYISTTCLDSTHAIISYSDIGNLYYGTAILATISETTITYDSEYVFNSNRTNYIFIASLDNTNAIIGYSDYANSNYGTAIIATTDEISITIKVWDGSSWIDSTAVKYYDGVSWVDITAINRSDGATWVTV